MVIKKIFIILSICLVFLLISCVYALQPGQDYELKSKFNKTIPISEQIKQDSKIGSGIIAEVWNSGQMPCKYTDCQDNNMFIDMEVSGLTILENNVKLDNNNACACRDACFDNNKCAAYTYYTGGQCRLWTHELYKGQQLLLNPKKNCISGYWPYLTECSFCRYVNYLEKNPGAVITFKLKFNDLKKSQNNWAAGYLTYDKATNTLTGNAYEKGLNAPNSYSSFTLDLKTNKGTLYPKPLGNGAYLGDIFSIGCHNMDGSLASPWKGSWDNVKGDCSLCLFKGNIPLNSIINGETGSSYHGDCFII